MTKIVRQVQKLENKVMGKLNKSGGLGRSIAKVIKPVLDAKNKVRAEAGRFARSPIGKIIITAVAIYFGGAAFSGAMGGGAAAATGATGWAGAQAGLSAAWSGIGTAGAAAMAGNFAEAGSALATGAAGGASAAPAAAWTASPTGLNVLASEAATTAAGMGAAELAGAAALEAGTAAAAVPTMASPLTASNAALAESAVGTAGYGASSAGVGGGAGVLAPTTAVAPTASPTMLQSFMANKYTPPALIQAGSAMLSSMGNAKGQQAIYDRQQQERDEERARYNRNIGTALPRRG